jgi:hypothetical protein
MTSEGARDRLAELSATAWVTTAIGVAVELGLPARLREPASARELADAMGIPVALARSLAEALVAGGLAQRADDGLVTAPGRVELAEGARYQFLRAETRAGLLQTAAFFDAATIGTAATNWTHADERMLRPLTPGPPGARRCRAQRSIPYSQSSTHNRNREVPQESLS